MEVEIARKVSKNNSMFRVVMERVCGIRFYTLEITINDWDKDDYFGGKITRRNIPLMRIRTW